MLWGRAMFERPHHQRIAQVLLSLDGGVLREKQCYFGGGTAIALRCGEYRESVDIDFLVSDRPSYRDLREMLRDPGGLNAITRPGVQPLQLAREIRADQYGIRCLLAMGDVQIKFEIILEGRIALTRSGEAICDINTLTPIDTGASKLLANSDRWADDGVFSRDIIDLAMLNLLREDFARALEKARQAYGECVVADLKKAAEQLKSRAGWLDRCIRTLDVRVPKALLWERIRAVVSMVS